MAPVSELHWVDEPTTYRASQSSRIPGISRMLSCPPRLRWASGCVSSTVKSFPASHGLVAVRIETGSRER